MGVVSAVQNYCLAGAEQDKVANFLDNNGKAINDDYAYFQQQNWFRLQHTILFDPNKFIFLFNNYKINQQRLTNQWKIVDAKKFKTNQKLIFTDEPVQPRWVYAIRRGVPIKYYKNVIQMLFAKNFNLESSTKKYQALLYEKMKKNGNKFEPVTFQQESQTNTFSTPFLNKQGMDAAKRISFLLSKTHSQLQYNIYIVNAISLLLIFVSEADTYDIIGTMIQGSTSMSVERQQSLRWHFTLTNNQLQKFVRQFFKTVKDISPSIRIINQHLNTQGIDKFQIFKQVIGDLFIGFLPFHIVLQVFLIFLNQGVKIFYRFFYAALKITGPSIRDSSNTKQIIRLIRTKLLTNLNTDKQIKQFFKYAYDLQLQNLLMKKAELQLHRKVSKKEYNTIYYLPEVCGQSQILSFMDMEIIWQFLPKLIKHYDARKIYQNTQVSSSSLKKMLQFMQQNFITMIVVQASNDTVFGVFIAQKIKSQEQLLASNMMTSSLSPNKSSLNKSVQPKQMTQQQLDQFVMKHSFSTGSLNGRDIQYFGSSQTFVFTLHPVAKKYPSTGQNICYCAITEDSFIIGGPNPALQLKSSLNSGISFSSLTYANDPLHGGTPGQFKIKLIQCFSIQ